jgi:DNA repair protein RecO (recombination protein O)
MPAQAKLYQIEGIVLGRRDQGEADRIITCLTPQGRMDLLAKGIRKPRSRKAGHLELFSRTSMVVSRVKASWDIVSQADAIVLRPALQDDFERATYARYVAELVLRFFEREANPELYELLDWTLSKLVEDGTPELLVRWYEQRLLSMAGFRPAWHACVGEREGGVCETPLTPRPSDVQAYGLDPERGGALCPECMQSSRAEPGVRLLSPSALSWLQALQRRDYEALQPYAIPDKTARELTPAMDHYIAHHLEYRPTSLRMIAKGK